MATTVAIAQGPDPSGLTGLDPLTRIVEGFASGVEADALYLQGESDAGPTGLTQFQVIVNMGSGPTFGEDGLEIIPSGLTDDGNLISLEEIFGGTFGTPSMLPPLAPFARGQRMDLTEVFEGWTAYGIQGAVEGPIELGEGVQVVAGIELPEPYDHECTERTHVGRAWVGSTVSAADPLFTAEALDDQYRDSSHSALAGRASRVIELTCFPGDGPFMVSSRMRDENGIRRFGPLEIFGMVKGNHVVIIAPIRVLDDDLTQRFYSTPSAGGDVVLSEIDDGARLLVPNPYGPGDIRIELRAVTAPADTGAANAPGDTARTKTLLYQGDAGTILPIQTGGGCRLLDQIIVILGWGVLIDDGEYPSFDIPDSYSFGPITSGSGSVGGDDDSVVSEITDGSGITQTATLKSNGTGDFTITTTLDLICSGPLEYFMSPNIFEGAGDSSGDSSGEAASDDDKDESDDESAGEAAGESNEDDEDSPGGVPWGPIAIALGLLAVATGTAVARRRSRTKDCRPEEAAYAAAVAAYEKAKKASAYYTGIFNDYNAEYNDYKNALTNRLDAPDRVRGYPEGLDGDKAYADAKARWDAREAKAERAEDNLDGARQNMESAKSDMDNAVKALHAAGDLIKQTNAALRACKGSAPDLPGDDTETPPTTPGAGGSGPTSPGTITDPPDTPDRVCGEGETREKILKQKTYRVLGGPVTFNLAGISDWNKAYPDGIDAGDLAELAKTRENYLHEMFADMGKWNAEKTISASIPTDQLTVQCVQESVCSNNSWVNKNGPKRVEQRTPASPIRIAFRAHDSGRGVKLVNDVNAKVKQLASQAALAADYTCD